MESWSRSIRLFLSKFGWPITVVLMGLCNGSPVNTLLFVFGLAATVYFGLLEYIKHLKRYYEDRLKMDREKLDTFSIDAKITMNKFLNLGDIKDPLK